MSSGISIVIPSMGDLENLAKLVPSILNQETSGVALQIIVVLNGRSTLNLTAVQEQIQKLWPAVEVLKSEIKGVNVARNAGLARARNEIVLFLDDDCELHLKTTLKNYLKLHADNPGFFAIGGGYVLARKHGLFDEVYNYIQMNWFVHGHTETGKSIVETRYLLGGNFSLKREWAQKFHLQFEPSIQYGGSELDFFRQATAAGLKLGAVEMDLTHNTNETFFSVGKKVFKQGRGKYFIDAKFGNEESASQSGGGRHAFLRRLLSYWFWAGYYGAAGQRRKLFIHAGRDIVGYLDVLRFNILKKLNR